MTNIALPFTQQLLSYSPTPLFDFFNSNDLLPLSMKPVMKMVGHKGCINTCSFNPYGEYELTGCDDGCVWLWDIGTRQKTPKIMLRPHITNVFTTNFLSSNRFISGGNDATIQCITIAEDRAITTSFISHHTKKVLCSFVIDENTFVTCSHDRTIRLFDIRKSYPGAESRPLPLLSEEDFNYNGAKRLRDDLISNKIRSQGEGGGLYTPTPDYPDSILIDLRKSPDCPEFYDMAVNPINKKQFLATASDGTVRLFDLRHIDGPPVGFSFSAHYRSRMNVTGVAYDETATKIAATIIGGSIHVLDASSFTPIVPWTPPPRPHRQNNTIELNIADIIDGETGNIDPSRVIALLSRESHSQSTRNDQNPPSDQNTSNDQNPPSDQQPSNEEEEREEEDVREAIHGEIAELKGHRNEETIKTVNWMGRYVVSGSDDGKVFFYDPDTTHVVNVFTGHQGNVNVVTVHPEKHLLATSGIDDYAVLWEPQDLLNVDLEEAADRIKKSLAETESVEGREPPMCNIM